MASPMIAVGGCIGSGIFRAPGEIVQAVPNSTLILIVWTVGGIVALTGALTLAELGGMFPRGRRSVRLSKGSLRRPGRIPLRLGDPLW